MPISQQLLLINIKKVIRTNNFQFSEIKQPMFNFKLLRRSIFLFRFSTNNEKIETLSLKKNTVLNLKQLSYEPKSKLEFANGKCLIYENKRSWYMPYMLYTHLNAAFLYLAYLMKYNPFYLTFPASLPIMIAAEVLIARRIFLKKKRNNNLISQIYLLEDGEVLEVHFANKIYRQLKGMPSHNLLFVSNMLTPHASQERKPLPDSITLFPQTMEKYKQPDLIDYAWAKYYLNWETYLMIPTRPDYINMEVMTQVFQGKKINV